MAIVRVDAPFGSATYGVTLIADAQVPNATTRGKRSCNAN
jgi:hypothetical protein